MAELTARRLVVFQPNVAWVDRRLAALALPAMKMMTSREPPEKYKAMMIELIPYMRAMYRHLHFSHFEV